MNILFWSARPLVLAVTLACALLSACSVPARLPAVPAEQTTQAIVPGMEHVRYWPDVDTAALERLSLDTIRRMQAYRAAQGQTGPLPPAHFLALSGGGDDGAFGAGLLNGWTATGTRPSFGIVTGISTGALIAPFAFLGPAYDPVLKKVYTETRQADIFLTRPVLAAINNDAMADTQPLWTLIGQNVDEDFLARIGAEYRKGRLLLIATTDIDARRPVLWDMGAIATSGAPGALDLFRRIMLASAAIPGVFPPVLIDVEVDGTLHQEMHVDGGAAAQVFLYPPSLNVKVLSKRYGIERERHAWIIRNARLDPSWASVERRTMSIAGRAVSSLIQYQGVGDLYRIYATTQRDGVDYNLAYIGSDFRVKHLDDFDPAYMRPLYEYGERLARNGYPWQKTPPGYIAPPPAKTVVVQH